MIRVGYGRAELPVPVGAAMGGYADRSAGATGVLDPLEVHALAVHDGDRWLVLVVADVVCVHPDLPAAVTAAVTAAGPDRVGDCAVWTLATHTHAGPDLDCGPGPRTTPLPWPDAIATAAATAARSAVAGAEPARLVQRTVPVTGVGAARDRAGAPAVVPVDTVEVCTPAGAHRGLLVVQPVHPTVLSADNRLVSGDLAAATRRALAATGRGTDPPGWVVVATGCAGNVSTRATRRAQTAEELTRLGQRAATQIAAGLSGQPDSPIDDGPIGAAGTVLQAPVRPAADGPMPVPAGGGDSAFAARFAHTLDQGRRVAAERARQHPDGWVRLPVSAARIGSLQLVGLGAEPYLAVRELAPAETIVLGYTNGYAGYLPDATAGPSYETLASPFRPDAADRAMTAAGDLLNQLRSG